MLATVATKVQERRLIVAEPETAVKMFKTGTYKAC